MAKARPLSFHATDVESEHGPHSAVSLSFSVEADGGDPTVHFAMTSEDADEGEGAVVRVAWGDGKDGRDESVVELSKVTLARGRFECAFVEPLPESLGPCSAVVVTFDALEPSEELSAVRALQALVPSLGDKLVVPVQAPAPMKVAVLPGGPRKLGGPSLGITCSSAPWHAQTKGELTIELKLTNLGGPLNAGVMVEIGGAALEGGRVSPKTITSETGTVTIERKGTIATANMPLVRIPADLDIDRRIEKKAPRSPTLMLTMKLDAEKSGSGLLTIRMRPIGRDDSRTMVGRQVVVTD